MSDFGGGVGFGGGLAVGDGLADSLWGGAGGSGDLGGIEFIKVDELRGWSGGSIGQAGKGSHKACGTHLCLGLDWPKDDEWEQRSKGGV